VSSPALGNLLEYNGSAWTNIATSSLGIIGTSQWATAGSAISYTGGNVGIGTTTPGSLLSLGGIANFTTATSTFYSTGGINIAAGCFSVGGVCVSGGGGGGVGLGANSWTGLQTFTVGFVSQASSTVVGTLSAGTTTINSLSVTNAGTSTFSGNVSLLNLNIAGSATTTAANGINLAAGCFAVGGNCLSLGNLSGTLGIGNGGTNAISFATGQLLAFDGTKFVSTTTIGNNQLANSSITVSTGSTGSDFNISGSPVSLGGTLTLSIPSASVSNRGLLNSVDWTTFNNKISSTSLSAAYPLTYNSSTGLFATALGTTTANTWSALQLFNGGASTTNLTATGTLFATNASTTNATSTSFFATTASSTNLFASAAQLGSLALLSPLGASSGGTGIVGPSAAGILLGSYAGGGYQQIATSSLGLTTAGFRSANISQWTNDAGYLTSLTGAASSTLLGDNNTFSGTDKFTNAASDFGGTWQTFSPSHFLTGNQTITISGAVSGSGATSIVAQFASTTPVQYGGTASTTLGGILAGNGTAAVKSAVIGTGLSFDGTTLTNTGLTSNAGDWAGTWQTFSPSHFQVAGTYLTGLGNYATTTGTALSLSTSTTAFNGLTFGQTIGVSANGLLFTPTISGTLNNGGLTNSSITITATSPLTGGGTPSLGGSTSLGCLSASGSQAGCLASADWTTFNNKVSSFSLTALYPFSLAGNATSTLTQFNGGITAFASSTIGNGNQNAGLTIFGGATTTGNLTVQSTGTSSFAGNIGISGSITPSADNTYSLGSAANRWADVYIGPGSLFVNNQEVLATNGSNDIVMSATTNQNLIQQTSGTGNIELNPSGSGIVQVKGNILLSAGESFTTTDASAVLFTDGVEPGNLSLSGNAISATNLNGGISITPNGSGGSYFTNGNVGIGTTNPSSKLEVQGTVAAQSFSATSTTATSTFADSLNLTGGCFGISGNCLGFSNLAGTINLASQVAGIISAANGGTGTTTWQTGSIPYFNGTRLTEDNANLFWDGTNHRLGIGTTTPGSIFSVQGVANWTGATSTMYSTGGINLTAGCFSINGTCIGGGGGVSLSAQNNWTGLQTFSAAASTTLFSSYGPAYFGATATSSFSSTGALSLGGKLSFTTDASSTNTVPNILLGPSALSSANANGTYIGINAPSSFGGNFIDFQQNGTRQFSIQDNVPFGGAISLNFGNTTNGMTFNSSLNNTNAAFVAANILTTPQGISHSGSGAIADITANFTLSQSGAGNGISRGLYINPTLTKAADFRALEVAPYTYNLANANTLGSAGTGVALGSLFNAYTLASSTIGTIPNAQMITITGAPIAGSGITISTSTALAINGGAVNGAGSVTTGLGLYVAAPTGATTNYAAEFLGGNVGIGTTSPWRTFSVNGTVALAGLTGDSADQKVLCLTAGNEVVANTGSSCITSSQRFKNSIQALDATSGLAEVLKLNPVSFNYNDNIGIPGTQVGFIAEQMQQVDPRLVVLDASNNPFTVRYENLTAILAKAIQDIASLSGAFKDSLVAWLGDAGNGIGRLFAGEVDTQKLCVGATCVNEQQLAALIGGQTGSTPSGQAAGGGSGDPATSTPDTPPVIQINGDNPATINVGATYNDLGATITGPAGDLNLGIHTLVGDTPIDQAVIDTSTTTTYHINYVATDQTGLTSTSTRTLIIQAPASSTSP
jgi:hypothetical protein